MDFKRVAEIALKLTALKYFPGEPQARLAVIEQLGEMCESEEQVAWLVKRTLKLFAKWPGIGELRAVLCSKFKPKDGFESYSETFPDGIPSEAPEKQWTLPAASTLALPPGDPVSAAPSIAVSVVELARYKRMEKPGPRPKDLAAVRITPENTITAIDIARAVEEVRRKRAELEAGLKLAAEVVK